MNASALYNVRLADGREFGPASLDLIAQWAREGRVPPDALLVAAEPPGAESVAPTVRSVLSESSLRAILQAPPTVSTGIRQPPEDAALSGMIPYKNPPALIGYYLAIGSLMPLVGIVCGVPAFILGIVGHRKRLKNPKVRGLAHAWIAIILGGLMTIVWAGAIVLMIIAANQ